MSEPNDDACTQLTDAAVSDGAREPTTENSNQLTMRFILSGTQKSGIWYHINFRHSVYPALIWQQGFLGLVRLSASE